uniref:Short-chain dehydrogenase/reductase family protein n=1 Tax=Populus trichocarpa TaxID=3694 RepID=A0A2K2B683_POPTR
MWFFGWKGPSGFSASSTAEEESGRNVKEAILKEIPTDQIDVMELDLRSMASVRKFASEYTTLGLPLNILINNAGVLSSPSKLSQDNIEMLFATNHIGHFLLTNLLLEIMKNTAQRSKQEGRIVNLANILHANELARRLKQEGEEITINSLHPGAIHANLLRHQGFVNAILNLFGKYMIKKCSAGAATTCYIALHPQVKGISGKYFTDSNIAEPSSQAKNAELAKKLWDFSFSITNK